MKKFVSIQIEYELPDNIDDSKLTTNEILDLFWEYHQKNKKDQKFENHELHENYNDYIDLQNPVIKFVLWDSKEVSKWYNYKKECLEKGKKTNIQITHMSENILNTKCNKESFEEVLEFMKKLYNIVKNKESEK